jgi:hypothetical protein
LSYFSDSPYGNGFTQYPQLREPPNGNEGVAMSAFWLELGAGLSQTTETAQKAEMASPNCNGAATLATKNFGVAGPKSQRHAQIKNHLSAEVVFI